MSQNSIPFTIDYTVTLQYQLTKAKSEGTDVWKLNVTMETYQQKRVFVI
jgi:hypothetical protein